MALTGAVTSAVRWAEALLHLHGADAEERGIDGGPAREAEAPLADARRVRVVARQPRGPGGDATGVPAGLVPARGVLHSAARAVGTAVLGRRAVAVTRSHPETSSARHGALAPRAPIRPVA